MKGFELSGLYYKTSMIGIYDPNNSGQNYKNYDYDHIFMILRLRLALVSIVNYDCNYASN
jgi:hypothetical protein